MKYIDEEIYNDNSTTQQVDISSGSVILSSRYDKYGSNNNDNGEVMLIRVIIPIFLI